MQRFVTLIFMMVVGTIGMLAQTQINITLSSGNTVQYTIQPSGVLSFPDENHMTVKETATSTATTYTLDEISRICFASLGIGDSPAIETRVYPNPVTNFLMVQTSQPVVAHLYSLDGRLVRSQFVAHTATLDLTSLSSGIYLLRLNDQVHKIVKRQ